jgi:hypothetical protein
MKHLTFIQIIWQYSIYFRSPLLSGAKIVILQPSMKVTLLVNQLTTHLAVFHLEPVVEIQNAAPKLKRLQITSQLSTHLSLALQLAVMTEHS